MMDNVQEHNNCTVILVDMPMIVVSWMKFSLAMSVYFIEVEERGLCLIWCSNNNNNGNNIIMIMVSVNNKKSLACQDVYYFICKMLKCVLLSEFLQNL
jgi:hypothetical protein